MIGPSVWGLSEIVQSEKGPTVIGPSVIGQSEILAQTDGPQRPWAQIVLGQNEIQASEQVQQLKIDASDRFPKLLNASFFLVTCRFSNEQEVS